MQMFFKVALAIVLALVAFGAAFSLYIWLKCLFQFNREFKEGGMGAQGITRMHPFVAQAAKSFSGVYSTSVDTDGEKVRMCAIERGEVVGYAKLPMQSLPPEISTRIYTLMAADNGTEIKNFGHKEHSGVMWLHGITMRMWCDHNNDNFIPIFDVLDFETGEMNSKFNIDLRVAGEKDINREIWLWK